MEILEVRYRRGRGEIDIVARDGEVLVFCEVKTRATGEFGEPEQAIPLWKQDRIRRTALAYLAEHGPAERICRFDVAALRSRGGRMEVNYITDAF